MENFWDNVANLVLPLGHQKFEAPPHEGQVVIELRPGKLCDNFVAVRAVTKLYEMVDGDWYCYDQYQEKVPAMFPDKGFRLITPGPTLPLVERTSIIPVFANHVRGTRFSATPQELAFRWKEKHGGHLIALDVNSGKGFFIVPTWKMFQNQIFNVIERKHRNFYENILSGSIVEFFLDVDGEEIVHMSKEYVLSVLFDCIEEAYNKLYPNAQYKFSRRDINIWDSSYSKKLSFHTISSEDCPVVWKNAKCLKTFVVHIRAMFFRRLLKREPDFVRTSLIDMSVYDSNKKFRLPWCTKAGEERYFEWYQHDNLIMPTSFNTVQVFDNKNIVLDGVDPVPDPVTEFKNYKHLYRDLQPYLVQKGMPHNVRWTTNITTHQFLIPPNHRDVLYKAMEAESKPMFLHERPNSYQRFAIEFDGIPRNVSIENIVVPKILEIIGLNVEYALKESPPRENSAHLRFIHLIFQCRVLSSHNAGLMERVKNACPLEWNIDASWTALRTVNSDKLDEFGNFSNRKAVSDASISRCSLLLAEDELPLLVGEETKKSVKGFKTLSNEETQILMVELNAIFGKIVKIESVKTFSNGSFCLSTNFRECPFKNGLHKRNTQKIYFQETYCIRACWDSDCKGCKKYYSYASLQNMSKFFPLAKFGCDWKKGEEMLNICNQWVAEKLEGVIPAGHLAFEKDSIYYYCKGRKAPIVSIRYNIEPPKCTFYGGDVPFAKNVKDLSHACHSFYSTIRLGPIQVDAEAVKSQWRALGVSEFHIDNTVGDINLSAVANDIPNSIIIIISPPGTNKTNGVRDTLHFVGDVATNAILLAENIASRLDTSYYRKKDGQGRTKMELTAEPRPVAFVVNSIEKMMDRKISEFFLDEISAALRGLVGQTMKRNGPAVLENLETIIRRTLRVIVASADISADLEGAWLKSLGKLLRVIYQPNHRSCSETRCIELKSDRQMWDVYVRILRHNATSENPTRLFFPSNTKATVKRAEYLCKRYWPQGRSIFVCRDSTELPEKFVSHPNETWINYDIVCISPKLKVGVSFTVPNHFDITMLFACSGTTSSNDAIQMMKRVRPDVKLLMVRVRFQGGEKKKELLEDETTKALETFTTENRIRRVLPPFKPNEKFESICDIINEQTSSDRENYVSNIRNALRVRGMTIELGGVLENESLNMLGPLPIGLDMKTPNVKDELIQAILDADDISSQEAHIMYEQSKLRSLPIDQQNQLDRYQIRKTYPRDGPLAFAELVKLHIKKNFREKTKNLYLYMTPMSNAAGLDESQFSFLPSLERENFMINRTRAHAMCALLPGFINNFSEYELKRDQLEDGEILKQQRLLDMDKSTAKNPITRTVKNFNKLFESLALLTLVPVDVTRPRKKNSNSRGKTALVWKFKNDADTSLFYAGIPKALPSAGKSLIIERPEIFYNLVRSKEADYPLLPISKDLVGTFVQSNPNTLKHNILAFLKKDCPALSVEWELYNLNCISRILCPKSVIGAVELAVHALNVNYRYTENPSHIPVRYLPTYCRVPRIRILQLDETTWTIVEDCSTYF